MILVGEKIFVEQIATNCEPDDSHASEILSLESVLDEKSF